jgi:hypothetical protein
MLYFSVIHSGRYIDCPANISIAYYIGVLAFLAPSD